MPTLVFTHVLRRVFGHAFRRVFRYDDLTCIREQEGELARAMFALQELQVCSDLCMDMRICMCTEMCFQELAHARAVQEVERKTADHAEIERLRAELARHAETGSCMHV